MRTTNEQSKKDRLITSTEAIGNNLYREYVPQQLKDAILSLESNNELASIQISTNSPIFPGSSSSRTSVATAPNRNSSELPSGWGAGRCAPHSLSLRIRFRC